MKSPTGSKHAKSTTGGYGGVGCELEFRFAIPIKSKLKAKYGVDSIPAMVIDVRYASDHDENSATLPEHYEYYIHYLKMNRRNDAWLKYEDLSETCDYLSSSSRKRPISDNEEEDSSDHEGLDKEALKAHNAMTRVKNINVVWFGEESVKAWYFSPLPPEFNDVVYFCQFCLTPFCVDVDLAWHSKRCEQTHPPGDEIYRDTQISVFEVDGYFAKNYCENLCYLAKLFLDHKTLQWDVEPFHFYVLCEIDERGAHLAGYFSKEKVSVEGHNVACILTLPHKQRRGYGKFLIGLSYELTLREKKFGSPETPLSDLGRVSYQAYWALKIISILKDRTDAICLNELVNLTGIRAADVQKTLEDLGIMKYFNGQYFFFFFDEHVKKCLRYY
eukprot:GHVL01022601.1.p1 GENE.GHVL01022601.1~~GHVL01022601.1.p1  ORF type:complete len:387 (-),score=36.10 GHVL01022601.1:263-1423(-)